MIQVINTSERVGVIVCTPNVLIKRYNQSTDYNGLKSLLTEKGYTNLPDLNNLSSPAIVAIDRDNKEVCGFVWALFNNGPIAYIDFFASKKKDVGYLIMTYMMNLLNQLGVIEFLGNFPEDWPLTELYTKYGCTVSDFKMKSVYGKVEEAATLMLAENVKKGLDWNKVLEEEEEL